MNAEMDKVESSINAQFTFMLIVIILAVIALLIISSLIANWFGNKIHRPLVQIQGLATRLSDGDLTTPIDVTDRRFFERSTIPNGNADFKYH